MGCEQLRQNLQLAFLLQWLPRRTSFSAKGALDENRSVPPANRRIAKARRRARDQARAHARLSRSWFAEARKTGRRSDRGDFLEVEGTCAVMSRYFGTGRDGAHPFHANYFTKLVRNFSFFASQSSPRRAISEVSRFSSFSTSSRFPVVCALRISSRKTNSLSAIFAL